MRKIRNPAAEIPLPGFEIFYEDFLISRKEELADLLSAASQGDFKILQQMAHKWKGFCAPYGFQELAEWSLKLEAASEEKKTDLCLEILHAIKVYLGD